MTHCYLDERQENLVRSLVSGLGTVEAVWTVIYGNEFDHSEIIGLADDPCNEEMPLWNMWNSVNRADFDAFMDCKFVRLVAEDEFSSTFTLNFTRIKHAINTNFGRKGIDVNQRDA